jgi:hypothetical protein
MHAPRILIFLLSGRWMGISRLPRALVDAGFRVSTMSRPGSYLSLTRHAQKHILIPRCADLVDFFVRTTDALKPDLIIPGCEAAVLFLQGFEAACRARGAAGGKPLDAMLAALRDLACRSLGDPAGYAATANKNALLQKMRELGIDSPDYAEVNTAQDAVRFADIHGYPMVLKSEYGSGGRGVRICSAPAEIEAGLRDLAAMPGPLPGPTRSHTRIVAQQFIRGMPAMQAVCAMNGKMLEQMQVLKQECHPGPTGPSSVVRFIEHESMDVAARRLVAALGFSGFAGIDFMVEEDSQRPWLIEFNPRPCPISHLGSHVGRDLARALWCEMTNNAYTREVVGNPPSSIALFPQEWQRDPQSPALGSMFHDIPEDDPALLEALMK